jgi:cyanate lyase
LELQLALTGISRREADRQLGMGEGFTSNVLRGKERLTDERFERLAAVLQVPEEKLALLRQGKIPRRPRRTSRQISAGEILRFLKEKHPEVLSDLDGVPDES